MSMRQHSEERQTDLWIPASVVAKSPGHPFYRRLNRILRQRGFDRHVEGLCAKFYAEKMGRPGIAPGVYFRMLLVGYFEGLDSERGIAWRCADSLGLREFPGFTLAESAPDHPSLSIIRRRLDLATHQEVFRWVLTTLGEAGLLKGRTIGVDATTLEANAALRSIVRRDTGESYTDFLTRLAKSSGIGEPQREDLVKLDKHRPKKGSNDAWRSQHDPDACITKMFLLRKGVFGGLPTGPAMPEWAVEVMLHRERGCFSFLEPFPGIFGQTSPMPPPLSCSLCCPELERRLCRSTFRRQVDQVVAEDRHAHGRRKTLEH